MARVLAAVMTLRRALLICLAMIPVQGLILHFEGRLWICKCGYVKLWENSIWSSGNSQHIADWYSLGHINHGILFAGVFALILRRYAVATRMILTGISGFLWETIENTALVINRFREVTISLDYYGDTVLNSVFDSLFMLVGFLLAAWVRPWISAAVFLGLELVSTLIVRDGLVLEAIMVVHPIQAILDWQLLGR